MLRKLLPRGKIIVLLRDTVERAYVDLVKTVAASKVGADAEEALMLLTHGCMRSVACPGDAVSFEKWGSGGAAKFKKCMAAGFKSVSALSSASDVSSDALECLADTAGPAGELDWGLLYSTFVLSGQASSAVTCPQLGDVSSVNVVGSKLNVEATAFFNKVVRQVSRRIYVGCLPPAALGRDATADISGVTPEEITAAFREGAEVIDSCSQTIQPGVSLPVPVDLMAGVVSGYDLNLVGVSADMPKTAKSAGKVIVDGEDNCFPGGVEGFGPNTPAHALARSMYIRPLQRIQAAYGRDVVSLMESSALKNRPLSVVDPILTGEYDIRH